jgi:hypothetical protein
MGAMIDKGEFALRVLFIPLGIIYLFLCMPAFIMISDWNEGAMNTGKNLYIGDFHFSKYMLFIFLLPFLFVRKTVYFIGFALLCVGVLYIGTFQIQMK